MYYIYFDKKSHDLFSVRTRGYRILHSTWRIRERKERDAVLLDLGLVQLHTSTRSSLVNEGDKGTESSIE